MTDLWHPWPCYAAQGTANETPSEMTNMSDHSAPEEVRAWIFAYLPTYLREALTLILDRQRFFENQMAGKTDTGVAASKFLLFSATVCVLLPALFFPIAPIDLAKVWLAVTVTLFVVLVSDALTVNWVWQKAGAKPFTTTYFSVFAYLSGLGILFALFILGVMSGTYVLVDWWRPDLYPGIWNAFIGGASSMPAGSWIALAPVVVFLCGGMCISRWHTNMWAEFRRTHGLSRVRSFSATAVCRSAVWVLTVIKFAVIYASLGVIILWPS